MVIEICEKQMLYFYFLVKVIESIYKIKFIFTIFHERPHRTAPNATITTSSSVFSDNVGKFSQPQNNTEKEQQKPDSNMTVNKKSFSRVLVKDLANCNLAAALSAPRAKTQYRKSMIDFSRKYAQNQDANSASNKWGSLRQNHPIQNPFHQNSSNRLKSINSNSNGRNNFQAPLHSRHSQSSLNIVTASNFDQFGSQDIGLNPSEFCLLDRKFARKSLSRRSLNSSKTNLSTDIVQKVQTINNLTGASSEVILNRDSSDFQVNDIINHKNSETPDRFQQLPETSEDFEELFDSKYFRQINRFVSHPRRSKLYKKDLRNKSNEHDCIKNDFGSSSIRHVPRIATHISPNHFHIPSQEIGDKMMPYRSGRIGRNTEVFVDKVEEPLRIRENEIAAEQLNIKNEIKITNDFKVVRGISHEPKQKKSSDNKKQIVNFDYRKYMKSILLQPRQESSVFNDEFIKHQ